MTTDPGAPPRAAEALLRATLPPGVVGASILGDAREEHAGRARRSGRARAAIWYWKHALRLATGYAWSGATEALVASVGTGRGTEMETLWTDMKFGARSVMRMPGSAAISVVVLALGIGLCSSMFSIVYGLYLRGFGFPDEERLVVLYGTQPARNVNDRPVSLHDFHDFKERLSSFEDLAGFVNGTVYVSTADAPRRYAGAFMTANAFDVLGVQPSLGRGFAPGEDGPDAPLNVILGHAAWRDDFGMDRGVIGRRVRVNGEPATVLGVMPEGFAFPENEEVWIPLRDDASTTERGSGTSMSVWGKLRAGVSHERAELEVAAVARQLEQEHPDLNEGVGARIVTPIEANVDGELGMIMGAMMVAALFVLLVACANVANLLLARAAMRTREAGIRLAMGGGRLRVMLPFLSESLVLAGAGALLGIGLAYVGVEWFDTMTAASRTGRAYFMIFQLDGPILLFVVALTVLTALAAGLAPALRMSATDVNVVLKDEGRGTSSLHSGRLARTLVIAEVALSCALLVGAGLMTKSIVQVGRVEYAYRTDELLTARVGLLESAYPDREARLRLWEELRAELAAMPQLEAAGLTTYLPHQWSERQRIQLQGREYPDAVSMPAVGSVRVSEGYFAALGVEVRGRDFSPQDDVGALPVVIVNEPMIERYLGADPIGKQFRIGTSESAPLVTVIGVVPDLHADADIPEGIGGFEPAAFYTPLRQGDASFMSVAVTPRAGAPTALVGDLRRVVQRLDPDLPIFDVFTQTEVIDRSIWYYSVFGIIFIAFGIAALFMASVGLYGVLSFAVSRRTQEMGIRIALGAAGRDVFGLVARQAAGQVGIGLAIGMALAFGVTRVIRILMFNVDPQDPLVFAVVFFTILGVGVAAAIFPARRATSVDPMDALRTQ